MKERSAFWDNWKGILIFLVVFGHYLYPYAERLSDSLANDIFLFIYTFHMPAYIFCSGFFSKSEHSRSRESLIQLMLYYAVFNTLMLVFSCVFLDKEVNLLKPYFSYWYILSLIVWRTGIGTLDKVKGLLFFSVVIALLMGYWSEFSNVLSLRRTFAFFAFFVAGYNLDREKLDNFIRKRKPLHIVCYTIFTCVAVATTFWGIKYFSITSSMTMMGAYSKGSDIFRRILLFGISAVAILAMLLLMPNRKIPLLTQIGRNSPLIYLAHRFATLIFYWEFFPYKTYSNIYVLYAFIATVVTCVFLSNEKMNTAFLRGFKNAAASIADRDSRKGNFLKTACILVFIVLLCTNAIPEISDAVAFLGSEGAAQMEDEAEETEYVLSAAQEREIEDSVRIAYVGDLILLKDQVAVAYDEESGNYDFSQMFEYAAPYLTDADFSIGVFEGPLAGDKKGYSTSNYADGNALYLNFPDEFAQAVKESGIDLVTTANNHLLDMGVDGAMRTLDVLDEVGLLHSGSYRTQEEKDEVMVVEVEGIKIAVLSYLKSVNNYKAADLIEELPYITSVMPLSENPYYDQLVTEIEEDFERAKQSGADIILVMAHMGTQFKTKTNDFQDKWNELFAKLGADIILGDHAHIVQPIEYIGDTLVVNCPGNFANSYIEYDGDATSIVEIYISRNTKEVVASSVIPMYTHEVERGYFRALPIYSIMSDDELYSEMWNLERKRIKEVHELVTEVMLGKRISLDDIQERYFFIDNQYYSSSVDAG